MARELRKDPYNLRDTIRDRVGDTKFATWYRGQEQIDAIWTSEDIEVDSITFLPFYFSIGDHRGIVMDIPEEELLGNRIMKIQRPYARRLITKRPEVIKKYIAECLKGASLLRKVLTLLSLRLTKSNLL